MLPIPIVCFVSSDIPETSLQKWIGPNLDSKPFKDFALARHEDLSAGAKEPHRTWLFELMLKQSNHLRDWAATRLVEAGAEPIKGVAYPNGVFLDACTDRFKRKVIWGNEDRQHREIASENPPREWQSLGAIADISPNASCWLDWRRKLNGAKKPTVTLGLYAIFSPRLEAGDETWVLSALIAACEKPIDEPWQSMAFLLATDWLMLYGQDSQWKTFRESCTPKSWRKAIEVLEKRVRDLRLYWCGNEGEPQGVRPALLGFPKLGPGIFVPPKFRKTTFLQPGYPSKASALRFSTDTRIDVQLDPQGKVIGQSLSPGYALGVFGPDALEWVARWTFEGAKLDGQPIPSYFRATVRFVVKP